MRKALLYIYAPNAADDREGEPERGEMNIKLRCNRYEYPSRFDLTGQILRSAYLYICTNLSPHNTTFPFWWPSQADAGHHATSTPDRHGGI